MLSIILGLVISLSSAKTAPPPPCYCGKGSPPANTRQCVQGERLRGNDNATDVACVNGVEVVVQNDMNQR